MKSNNLESNRTEILRTIQAKLLAIGELIKFRGGEPSLEDEMVNYGLGMILTDLANDLQACNLLQIEV